jgi:hypothetical protein
MFGGNVTVRAVDRKEAPACDQQQVQKLNADFDSILSSFDSATTVESFGEIERMVITFATIFDSFGSFCVL